MKFCDITQFYSPVSGGVKRYVHEKIDYLKRKYPDDSHILIIPGEKTDCIETQQSKVYTVASPVINRQSRYRALLNLQAIREILEYERPHLIESGDPYQVAWKAQSIGRELGVPVVGFYHSHFPEAYVRGVAQRFGVLVTDAAMDMARRYIRALYSRFDKTLVPSQALTDLLYSWQVANAVSVNLGVNTAVFKPTPNDAVATRRALGISPDHCLLLYVGRLASEKNTQTLFDAYERIAQEHPQKFHLLIIGDGTQRGRIDSLLRKTRALTWQTYCNDSAELARLYRAADLFVHPGIQETFGLVTLESQACGTPVIGIWGSYMDRIIFSDQKLWAKTNTSQALADAIAAQAKEDLATMGLQAAACVHRQYSWDAVFDRIFEIYRTLVFR